MADIPKRDLACLRLHYCLLSSANYPPVPLCTIAPHLIADEPWVGTVGVHLAMEAARLISFFVCVEGGECLLCLKRGPRDLLLGHRRHIMSVNDVSSGLIPERGEQPL